MANDNPILELIIYEVEYCNGYIVAIAANVIAEKLFTQVDQEGNRFVLIDSIIDTRTDSMQKLQKYVFIITTSGTI